MDVHGQNLDAGTSCQWYEINDCTVMELVFKLIMHVI
jgi:hypothetical protein